MLAPLRPSPTHIKLAKSALSFSLGGPSLSRPPHRAQRAQLAPPPHARPISLSTRMMAVPTPAYGNGNGHAAGATPSKISPSPLTVPYDALADVTADVSGEENVLRLRRVQRDFRSDTITMQTDAQMLASLRASRGDDVFGEDEVTRKLEERAARMCGKEDALFAVSGTLTNQLAIRTHMVQPPYSIICDYRAHVHKMEAGAIAVFTGATTHQLFPSNDIHLTAADIEPHLVLGDNIHTAPTKLICLENTLSGTVMPQDEVVRIGELAKKHEIALHLDGARAWNVAAKVMQERGLDARDEEARTTVMTELLEPFDTASLCLSKGIGAPVGSILVGPKAFIKRARWFRKMYGAGVRQIGMVSASADYALTHYFPRLAFTHTMARRLEQGLRELGCDILAPVDTNMVFFSPTPLGLSLDAVLARLQSREIPITLFRERIVVHHQISPEAIEEFIDTVRDAKEELAARGEAPVQRKEEGVELAEGFRSEGGLRRKVALGY